MVEGHVLGCDCFNQCVMGVRGLVHGGNVVAVSTGEIKGGKNEGNI